MSSPDELALLADDDLFEFLLKEGCFMPDISVGDNVLLEDWGLPEPEPLDKDMDDFITSILNPFQNGAGMRQDCLPADGDIDIPEDQLQLLSFVNEFGFSGFSFSDFAGNDLAGNDLAGNNFAGNDSAGSEIAGSELPGSEVAATDPASDTQNSEAPQVDHSSSLHWDWSLLQSIASELADVGEENISTDVDNWQREEGTSMALVPTSGFPVPASVDAVPQVEPAITMQASFPELVLTEEQKQLLLAEDFTYLPLTQVKDQLVKKARRKVRNKHSTQNIYRRKKRNMKNLENKVAACMAQNQSLGNIRALQKQNRSLFGQFRELQAFVSQPSNRTAVAKTYMTAILSFGVFFSQSACMIESIKANLDLEAADFELVPSEPPQQHSQGSPSQPEVPVLWKWKRKVWPDHAAPEG
ncbi:cyclic AMP-responsive element-binding protein 3-like protein 4 [Pezoporus wallicus]|uniref:cyclic AMP-responsive element-binding protein 3-like protein 4 n=1 Tax=Pezoporus wallicus TaxID=35540 RepID=UPI00254B0082|nr:cyclic AMP-responsive element-binding protein 3-like protein 4 [Pezoporus wallicus]